MSLAMTIVIGIVVLVIVYGIVGLSLSVKHVPPGHARSVTRLPLHYDSDIDRFLAAESHRILGPGWHLVFPGRDRVGRPIDLSEQTLSLPGQHVLTADKARVTVDTEVSFRITDPSAALEFANQKHVVGELVAGRLRYIIGSMDLEQTLGSRDEISAGLRGGLDEISGKFGFRVSSVDVHAIEPGPEAGAADPTELLPVASTGPGIGPDQAAAVRADRDPLLIRFLGLLSQFCLKVGIPGVGVMAMFFSVPSIGPAWSAHLGHGPPGIFTATTTRRWTDCSGFCHTDVTWYGTFTARDGSFITGVRLADGGHITGLFDSEAVRYEGGGVVYPAGGGPDWLPETFALIAGIAGAGYWIFLSVRLVTRRRRRLRTSA